ncbi:MAG: sigma-70 family RNA polymerase sigma factor [Gemmatimonadetes bacterium]|nr:sigma-70 family RNA polymerase sigma factor [Gemmatimonadota bacterium]
MSALAPEDAELLGRLRGGEEEAFATLVDRYQTALIRVATKYVRDPVAAADVAQETWIGFIDSLDRFEGRCSLQTWLFRILFNKAQSRVQRDRRIVPFSTLVSDETSASFSAVDPTRFTTGGDAAADGHWLSAPPSWKTDPSEILEQKDAVELVERAIGELPEAQGTVMILRDVEGWSSEEVCNALEITPTNQRVLLHRARTRVRRALSERYGDGT